MLLVILLFLLYIIVLLKVVMHFINNPARKKNDSLYVVFAPPGCGKSTALAYLVRQYRKKGITCYCNSDVKGTIKIDWTEHIGKYDFRDCVILIDEASIDLNNRNFKEMGMDKIKYLKLHRHYRAHMWFFSQSYDDMDITVRRLADRFFTVNKTFFNFVTKNFQLRAIRKKVGIEKEKHQIMDMFDFVPLSKYTFNGRKCWKLFDSFYAPELEPIPPEWFEKVEEIYKKVKEKWDEENSDKEDDQPEQSQILVSELTQSENDVFALLKKF